jgi:hypothetical protein
MASKSSLNNPNLSQFEKDQVGRLQRIIIEWNREVKNDVFKFKEKYNKKVRGLISDIIGLSLSKPSEKQNEINIKVEDLIPESLVKLLGKYSNAEIDLILHFSSMKRTLEEIRYQIDNFDNFSSFHRDSIKIDHLLQTEKLLKLQISRVNDSEILQEIRNLGPDLLGVYYLGSKLIHLYWICIGLCTQIFDIELEEITLIVLIHELVHGYTHLGYDKDGENWDLDSFEKTDPRITEGFAQFYTEYIYITYFDKSPEKFRKFNQNLPFYYTEYEKWFDKDEKGIWAAIMEFLFYHEEWELWESFANNNGLTILRRK